MIRLYIFSQELYPAIHYYSSRLALPLLILSLSFACCGVTVSIGARVLREDFTEAVL
jgi:hypothetical protein